MLGLAQRLGFVALPHDLHVLGSTSVLAGAALLFALNFLADKIPYVDSLNDLLHTLVCIPVGALLALFAAGLVWLLPKLVRLALLPFRRLRRRRQEQ